MPDFTVHRILAEGEQASNWIDGRDDRGNGVPEYWSAGVVESWNGTVE